MKEIIKKYNDQKIYFSLSDSNKIKIKAEKGIINDEIRSEILEIKKELTFFLINNKEKSIKYKSIPRVKKGVSYAISSAQRRLWILSQFDGGNLAYNIPEVYEFEGELDTNCFQKAFDTLIERHEILRTVLKKDASGEIRQWIKTAEEQGFKIDYQDLRKIQDQESKVKALVQRGIKKAFDLEQGPLLRAQLLQTAKDKYTFSYVMHHIISDGWSMGVLIKELLTLYNSYSQGKPNPLEALALQYKDYSAWQLDQLEDEKGQGHKAYWLKQFSGELPILELPTDHLRPALKTYNGNTIRTQLSKEKIQKLKAITQAEGATFYMGILSLVKTLLYRYTNQEDIIIGTHIAGREHADLSDQIGFYINTLALRSQISGDESFRELLKRVKQTTLDAYEHQSYPFDVLIENLGLKKDISRSPLFDIWVVLQNLDPQADESLNLGDIKVSAYEDTEHNTSQFDISFIFSESEEGLYLALKYNTDLFERKTIDRLQTHLNQLLAAIVESPEKSINSLNYLSKKEQQQILLDFNDTNVDFSKDKTIVHLFEEQAAKTPDNIALVFEEKEFTYQELDILTNQLAHCLLTEYKIQPEEIVGIQLERSPWLIISILGILKAGGAYLPIDTEYPASRKEFLLKDSNTQLLITSTNYIFDLDFYDGNIFSIDVEFEANNYPTESVKTKQNSSNLAYVIYTSGSTGNPKGVMIEHSSLYNYIVFCKDQYFNNKNENNNFTLFTSISFDLTVTSIYASICFGGKLKIENFQNNFKELFGSLETDIIKLTPAHISILKSIDLTKTKIKKIIVGGDKLNRNQVDFLYSLNKDIKIFNEYGPTEATVGCSVSEIQFDKQKISIGKPIANTQIYILGNKNELLPIGVVGEICLSGSGLARGYINRPKLTAEKFVSNPFKEGERMYKTGDLGRWLPDGNIEFIGRKDEQVKIRGYRIELGEIENILQQYPAIDQAVVLVKEDANQEKQLVAYLTSKEEPTTSDLRVYLKKNLPDYMLPSHFVPLEAFPLTPNGKVDKKALPNPEGLSLLSGVEYVAPSNKIEKELVEIWSEVLKVEEEKIGIKDDFFALGGDSIIAIRLLGKINQNNQSQLSIAQLYSTPTIEGVYDFIINDSSTADNYSTTLEEIEKEITDLKEEVLSTRADADEIEDIYPMLDIQKGMCMSSLLYEGEGVYHDQLVYQVEKIELSRFRKAVELLVEKHAILRSRFNLGSYSQDIQIIYKNPVLEICYEDLSHLTGEKQKEQITFYLEKERTKGFEINEGHLWKINIFDINAKSSVYILQFHHAIFDGWSRTSFEVELFQIYRGLVAGSVQQPILLQTTYRDAVIEEIYEKHNQTSTEYWKKELEEYKRLDLFSKEPCSQEYRQYYDADLLGKLEDKAKQDNISIKTIFLGSFLFALNILSQEKDLTIGLVTNTRPLKEDGDRVLGCFLNSIPFRFDLDKQMEYSCAEYLKEVDRKQIELKARDRLSLFEISKITNESVSNANPFFDVLFNYVNFHSYQDIKDENVIVGEDQNIDLESFERTNTFLNLGVNTTLNQLSFRYQLHKQLKSKISLEKLHTYTEKFLLEYLKNAPSNLGEIEPLTSDEKQQLLIDFNDTKVAYPKDKTIIDLFEEQVQKTPNNIALVFEEKEFTYQEINERANHLGNYLRSKYKIQADDLIAIKLDRSEWMIISILGVLKSGGAYVPIDPEYPEERISFMLRDSQPKVVIDEKELEQFKNTQVCYIKEPISVKSEDLAYVIYTSGSTGKPKGVMIQNSSVTSFLNWCTNEFKTSRFDVVFGVTSICFDLSIYEIFYTLITGKVLRLLKSALAIKDYLGLHKNILLNTVPSVVKNLLKEHVDLSSVSILNMAGEPISKSIIERLDNLQIELRNLYGPSEDTTYSTSYTIVDENNILIGTPIANTQIYILDVENRLLPIGVTGEICIAGDGLARGYLNRPELTAEKFVSNPFRQGERMYKTGDLGRWLPDGNIEFMGRKDDQVKIRGYRIELGEIESSLLENTTIEQAIVQVKETTNHDKQLIAYLISKEELTTSDLRSFLKKRLPDYMLPSHFVLLEELPLTPNGKIDKKVLPSPEGLGLATGVEYIAPSTEIEKELVRIWSEVLNVEEEKIGIKDDFFDLGGHSLNAVNIVKKVREKFDVGFGLRDLFQLSTVKEQSIEIVKQKNNSVSTLNEKEYELIHPFNFSDKNQVSLLLFPFAGATNTVYYPLAKKLADTYNVYIVSFPWHSISQHFNYRTYNWIEHKLIDEIKDKVKGKVALLGASASTTFSLSMAHQLKKLNYPVIGIFQCAKLFDKNEQAFNVNVSDELIWEAISNVLGYEKEAIDQQTKKWIANNLKHDAVISSKLIKDVLKNRKIIQSYNIPIHAIFGGKDLGTVGYENKYKSWESGQTHQNNNISNKYSKFKEALNLFFFKLLLSSNNVNLLSAIFLIALKFSAA